jgi:hypothetical protein
VKFGFSSVVQRGSEPQCRGRELAGGADWKTDHCAQNESTTFEGSGVSFVKKTKRQQTADKGHRKAGDRYTSRDL